MKHSVKWSKKEDLKKEERQKRESSVFVDVLVSLTEIETGHRDDHDYDSFYPCFLG